MRATEADPAVDGSRVRAERRPPPLPHPQSPARGQVSVHSARTAGRTDQFAHRSEAGPAANDPDPDSDLARIVRGREARAEDGDSERRLDRGGGAELGDPRPATAGRQRVGPQAGRREEAGGTSELDLPDDARVERHTGDAAQPGRARRFAPAPVQHHQVLPAELTPSYTSYTTIEPGPILKNFSVCTISKVHV